MCATRGERATAPAPSSYRDSHLGAAKARSYDEDLWDLQAAKGLDWLVEQRLLAGILRSSGSSAPGSAADFACGTGRVLEFLGRYFPAPVGIDVSPDMLALARARCPRAELILGDVTTMPSLAPGPFDLITAFRFFLNAEPPLRSEVLAWMRASLRPAGLLVANFHLNPASPRGMYLRTRMNPAGRVPMMGIADARKLFEDNGFTVRQILGYSFLPYRRDGRNLWGPGVRRRAEMAMAGSKRLAPVAGSFLVVASPKPSGPGRLTTYGGTPRQNPASPAVRVAQDYARHPAVWRFLLPRQVSGRVVLANLDEITTQNLLHSYPAALVLGRSAADLDGVARAAIWDGRRAPLRPGTVALLICDDRDGMCARALASTLAEGGECVAIVRSAQPYRFALFPTPEQVRAVIGGGWPLTYDGSPRRWLGYWLATTRLWRYLGRSGLAVRWPNDSVVDVVLDQVGARMGSRAYLRGLIGGRGLGQLTLRVSCEEGELAVRVAVTPDSARRLRNHQRVLADLSTRLGSTWRTVAFPDVVAGGKADGISWAAERWVKLPAVRASRSWKASGRGWDALRAIASELAAVAGTGHADADWARGWVAGLDAVAPGKEEEILAALAPIGAANMATAWCHGDLWPGNVFLRKPPLPPVVIDWERARPDAPAGLDAVYAELCRVVMHRNCTFGDAAALMARSVSAELAAVEVGGKPFASWDQSEQTALLLATVIHYATGENEGGLADRWTEGWGAMHIAPLMSAMRLRVASWLPACSSVLNSAIGPSSGIA